MKKGLYLLPYIAGAACLGAVLHSCASMGNPSGGARDEDPPRFVRSNPMPYATGVKGNRVEIEFDELVNVKDAFTNVVVSPPDASTPRVTASGRKIYVQWEDTLRSGTTYTVDFGKSITDVNEGNPLGSYSFTFATGQTLDSLRIAGVVLDAATLEPQQGMLVGVHRADAPDTAFRTLRFDRATKTDDRGRFVIRGLKAVPYNLFALGDLNNDYRWDNPAELIAFYPVPVTPYAEQGETVDSIYNPLTGAVDSVVNRRRTVYKPDNLLLSVFDIGYKPQYLAKYERPDSLRLRFILNAPSASIPFLSLPDYIPQGQWYVAEHTAHNDTVTYWLTDRRLIAADSLRVAVTFDRHNKERELVAGTDTVLMTLPRQRAAAKPKKRTRKQIEQDSIEAEKLRWLPVRAEGSSRLDVLSPIVFETEEPLLRLDTLGVHLEVRTDTVWEEMALPEIKSDTTGNLRRYSLSLGEWKYGAGYRLTIDSLALQGLTGRYNKTLTQDFTTKKREDYALLNLRLIPDTIQGYVEVLNSSDSPVARAWVTNGAVSFPYLAPADYYVRFVAHRGDRMEFTPGDYDKGLQPDEVYYYPAMISLKRHDRSEQWDLNAKPVDAQKPDAIKKNKPERKSTGKKKKNTERQETEQDDFFDVSRNPFT